MSYQVIARKYRPQVFDEVVGQRLITETLKNAIVHNRVAHGYIFSGARGVGKTTTARILAKSLNCVRGPTVTPCGECPSCLEIAAGNSVDVLEIDAASNRGIDEMRELRETVRYLPARDRYKAFIIDEVHMLTTEAFNALLKTLEEPPPRSLFILATTEAHKLPTTIQSRCQHFAFRLLDYAEIYAQLERISAAEKIQAGEKALSAIAEAAEGSLRDALSILDQMIAACGERLDEGRVRQLLGVVPLSFMRELVEAIHAGDGRQVLERVNQLAAEGYELGHFCGEFTRFVRDLMISKNCGAESPLLQAPKDERQALGELAKLFSEEDLSRFFQILLRTEAELRYSLQPRFHLELGLMKLVHTRKLESLEGLLGELRASSPALAGAGVVKPGLARPGLVKPEPAAEGAPPAGNQAEKAVSGASAAVRGTGSAHPSPIAPKRQEAAGPAGAASAVETRPAPGEQRPHAPADHPSCSAVPPAGTGSGPLSGEHPKEDARLAAIKAAAFGQSQMLGSCLDALVGWRFENGEVRFTYAKKDSWAAHLLRSREWQEALRSACAQVLGEAVRVCVTLLDGADETAGATPGVRERAGRDPVVEAFRRRFDCALVDVKDLSQE
jgi:DNA polymerase-3 subunit gamma/tau